MPLDGASYYNLGCGTDKNHPFAVDAVSNSLRVKEYATYGEVLEAIGRLADLNSDQNNKITDYEGRKIEITAVQAKKPSYIPVDDVGIYNEKIITEDLLNSTLLGTVDKAALPYWTGYILENKIIANQYYSDDWEQFNAGAKYFCEDEIRYLSENGFNCVRAVYSFCFLSNPNDINLINISELEQLDELISWGLKYNVHVMLSITGIPGVWGMSTEEENLTTNNAVFNEPVIGNAFARYWKMLSRRYAGIPNGALSFELMAESDVPNHDAEINENLRLYCDYLIPIAKSIWEDRDDRIVGVLLQGKYFAPPYGRKARQNHYWSISKPRVGSCNKLIGLSRRFDESVRLPAGRSVSKKTERTGSGLCRIPHPINRRTERWPFSSDPIMLRLFRRNGF